MPENYDDLVILAKAWAAEYGIWMSENPDAPATNAQVMAFLYRYHRWSEALKTADPMGETEAEKPNENP